MYLKKRRKMFELFVFLGINGFVGVMGSPNGQETLATISSKELNYTMSKDIVEDILLDVPQLIEKYGYPIETHEIKTEDGYLVTMHRIPGEKVNSNGIGVGIPVMMMHGLQGSSSDWIINGPKKSLGYILADHGYDVWLGNARGNYYSRKHTTLNPDESIKFWLFSWHEIGYYDIPACIDYILEKTNREKLHYIGHSQGTTVFFVMTSMKPEYNKKVILMQALAPITFISHLRSPVVRLSSPFVLIFEVISPILGIYETRNPKEITEFSTHELCNETSVLFPTCISLIFLTCGYDPEQLNNTMLPVYVSHAPAGASSRQLFHYRQLMESAKFRQYDHGKIENVLKYGQTTPPSYNISKITAPIALHYSDNDLLSDTVDVELLYKKLPNSVGKFRVPLAKFSHLDFIWAIDAPTLLYDSIRKLLLND